MIEELNFTGKIDWIVAAATFDLSQFFAHYEGIIFYLFIFLFEAEERKLFLLFR